MTTTIELLRSTLEEIELIEASIVSLYSKTTHPSEHMVRYLLDRHSQTAKQALTLLNDPLRSDQIAQIGGSDAVASFQAELATLQRRFPPTSDSPPLQNIARDATRAVRRQARDVIDLRASHKEWQSFKKLQEFRKKENLNLLWYRKLQTLSVEPTAEYRDAFFAARKDDQPSSDYITYLMSDLCDFRSTPRYIKYSESVWRRYLENLLSAVVQLCAVHLPLFDVDTYLRTEAEKLENCWTGGNAETDAGLADWRDNPTWKSDLYIPDRLYANANVMRGKEKLPIDESVRLHSELKDKELALLELLITALCKVLPIAASVKELQRRESGGQAELGTDETSEEEEIDERVATVNGEGPKRARVTTANPLELPLGLDGKPIPFWLYKLHGLGIEHECEICGNFKYKGQRVFELHFQEARHTQALRLLGIENSATFKDIVKIEEAVQLNQKLIEQLSTGKSEPQFEDSMGNVLSRRDYLDLVKQGLL